MGEEADSLYIMLQGNVSVEASFVELPTAQRAVDFPVNVSSSSGWCARAWVAPGQRLGSAWAVRSCLPPACMTTGILLVSELANPLHA